jgi:hypothetical protein
MPASTSRRIFGSRFQWAAFLIHPPVVGVPACPADHQPQPSGGNLVYLGWTPPRFPSQLPLFLIGKNVRYLVVLLVKLDGSARARIDLQEQLRACSLGVHTQPVSVTGALLREIADEVKGSRRTSFTDVDPGAVVLQGREYQGRVAGHPPCIQPDPVPAGVVRFLVIGQRDDQIAAGPARVPQVKSLRHKLVLLGRVNGSAVPGAGLIIRRLDGEGAAFALQLLDQLPRQALRG